MKGWLLRLLRCPTCGATIEARDSASVVCSQGHSFAAEGNVADLLVDPGPEIKGQIEENARERRGELSPSEKDAYRRNISRIGLSTYNELIRDNARVALDEAPVRSGRSLDLGGGSGWLAGELLRRGFEAASLDIEDPRARAKQIVDGAPGRDFELVTDVASAGDVDGVEFIVADMERLPFADASFEIVSMSAALHHSNDPVKTLREAARVIRPGGVMLAVNEPVKGMFRDTAPILGGRASGAGEHIYSAGDYLRFFRSADLQPRLIFPGWVDRKLQARDWNGVVYYPRLRRVMAGLWRVPPIRSLARGPLLRPGMDLFGLTLVAIATVYHPSASGSAEQR